MKAVQISTFGGPSVLKVKDLDSPHPNSNEVLIAVHAAGVNPVDTKIPEGTFKSFRPKLPAILGRDISGVVVKRGPKSAFQVGDEVFGMLDYQRGAYAELAIGSSRELARKPKGLGFLEAGGIGVAALTAWQGLFDHGKLKRGQRVLIHGGAGGVGHLAVQFAKMAGATVIATAGKGDLRWLKGLGADRVIDYANERFDEETGNIDLVFDLIAGETQERSWQVLKPGGIMVSTLKDPSRNEAKKRRARGMRMVVLANSSQLKKIGRMVAAGSVKVHVGQVFPLSQAARAHARLVKGGIRGKIVLRCRPPKARTA